MLNTDTNNNNNNFCGNSRLPSDFNCLFLTLGIYTTEGAKK